MATRTSRATTVSSVPQLQDLLGEAVQELRKIGHRDDKWIRLAISSVNSGNSLLRTEQNQRRGTGKYR